MTYEQFVAPVLKWVGGKRQLLPVIEKVFPEKFTTYYEPFLGGGAVLFHIQPQQAVVNDLNSDLINVYQVIKDDVEGLIDDLRKHKNTREYFYGIRELDRNKKVFGQLTKLQKASRIIYLNKTCYNGLYRVNSQGEFNSPFGNYQNPNIVNIRTLRAVSRYFNTANITFRNVDFVEAVKGARKGSFVYLDPPYDPISSSANFTGYIKDGFDRREQKRLRQLCDNLNARGIKFLLSNSATDFIIDLYSEYKSNIVQAKRAVNSRGDRRGEVNELLVTNY